LEGLIACRLPAGNQHESRTRSPPRSRPPALSAWQPGHTVLALLLCWQMTRLRMAGLPPTHHTTRHKDSWARDLWCAVASGASSFASLTLASRYRPRHGAGGDGAGGLELPRISRPSITALSGDVLALNAESRPAIPLPLLGFRGGRSPPSLARHRDCDTRTG
jgi:hypothetical protein